jgi:hypothetical protein
MRFFPIGWSETAATLAPLKWPDSARFSRPATEVSGSQLKRILKLDRLRLRGPNGARDEFHLAATAQNLRKLGMLIPTPRRA